MKKFGFILMAAAVAALSFTSCDNKNNDEDIDVDPIEEIVPPTVDATPGAVTLLVKFAVAPCEGYEIRFVGDHAENSWDPESAPAMESIGDGWYKYLIRPGKNEDGTDKDAMSGRPIQGNAEDIQWSYDWSHDPTQIVDVKGVNEGMKVSNEYGETNLNFTAADAADGAVVAFYAKKWNVKPCASAESYKITVILPEFCGEEPALELVGSFEGWGTTPVALTKVEGNKFSATITAMEGDQWKVRGEGTWDIEIKELVPGDPENDVKDSWKGVDNNVLEAELDVTVDYSDATKFAWSMCIENEEEE